MSLMNLSINNKYNFEAVRIYKSFLKSYDTEKELHLKN